MSHSNSPQSSIKKRYTDAAKQAEPALCCPVEYAPKYLQVIPDEVIEKDYGCGDPSSWLQAGETVLDLGSGMGKICFIAAQVVGAEGRVIGIDMTDEMLAVARRNAPIVADRIGYSNVEFRLFSYPIFEKKIIFKIDFTLNYERIKVLASAIKRRVFQFQSFI